MELLKQKPTKRPNWEAFMSEIEEFRYGFGGRLKKTTCNDRSGPILSTTKVGDNVRPVTNLQFLGTSQEHFVHFFKFYYDSEKDLQNKDILKDIKKGVRLKHVRTNDRSKPNLRGEYGLIEQLTNLNSV